MFSGVYQNRKVLVTGHTGFKGSWLSLWLTQLGANVTGVALPTTSKPNHWELLSLNITDCRADIRNLNSLQEIVLQQQPEIVFHLAAQPLVRKSYADPLETWSTNLMGTANLLEACRFADSVRAIIVVTSDKCYQNQEQIWGYRDADALGGHDPYSASKAATEIIAASYRQSFFSQHGKALVATARAGNVIGGGDWSEDRLIPDAARAVAEKKRLEIRSPSATRPWQHVLDCLSGYLMLGERLFSGRPEYAESWNFGPGPEGNRSVASVLQTLQSHWPDLHWEATADSQLHEAKLLQLDSTKARTVLGWQPVWSVDHGIERTAAWFRRFHERKDVLSPEQLTTFVQDAARNGFEWVTGEPLNRSHN